MIKRIFAIVLCICALMLCTACKNDTSDPNNTPSTTTAEEVSTTTTPPATTLSPEELKNAEHAKYLSTVDYLDFELTGSSEPYFMGRWFERDLLGETHMVTLTDGSLIYFLINGASSFEINFRVITTLATPYFAYSIDGGTPVRQLITDKTVNLPDTGRHTVRIIADGLTESEGKWTQEKGFALKNILPSDGGEILGIKPKNKIIFYYGDSITEGIRALSMENNSNGNSATNAYPWFCSEKLGAVTYSVGYGGTGIAKEGSFNTFLKTIDYNSKDRLVEDGIIPDVIVINHGTNDYPSTNTRDFIDGIKAAVDRLREKYPDAPIVYVVPFARQMLKGNIEYALRDYSNAYVVDTADWEIAYTDSVHPSSAGAKTAGENLADALINIFGKDFFE